MHGQARRGKARRGKGDSVATLQSLRLGYSNKNKENEMKFKFTLNGKTPLLIHSDDVIAGDRLQQWRKDPTNKKSSVAGDDRSPAWSWMTYLYHDNNVLTVPTDNLARCMVLAGTQITLKKQTTMKSVAASGLFIHEIDMPIVGPMGTVPLSKIVAIEDMSFAEQVNAVRSLGFDLFVKRAKVGTSKHVRVRPRFNQWSLSGVIEITCPDIREEHLRQMFEIAGTYKGLCDWRPSSPTPGKFGTFTSVVEKL